MEENKVNITLDKIRVIFNKRPKLFISLFTIIIVAFISIIIFIAFYSASHDHKITVINLGDYAKNMPSATKDDIYETIYRTAELNSSESETSLSFMTATLRDGSFKETFNKTDSVYSGEFIVDIEAIKQSYRIYYDWTTNKNTLLSSYGASANCLKMSNMIYPFFNCSNAYDDASLAKYNQLYMILPYNTTLSDGTAVSVSEVNYYYGSNEPYIRISVDACGNKKALDEGVSLIRDYLSSYNFNLDDYKYLTSNLCDGGDL